MKTQADKTKQANLQLDLRVRARHLESGALDPKVLERHLADLQDMEHNAETITFEQPALSRTGAGDEDA